MGLSRSSAAVLLIATVLAAPAQVIEIPRERPVKVEPHSAEELARKNRETNGHVNGKITVPHRLAPPVYVRWEGTPNRNGGTDYKAYTKNQGSDRLLARDDLRKLYDLGGPVVNSGAVPHDRGWQQLAAGHENNIVVHEEKSANQKESDIVAAVELAGKPLTPANTRVFNALPHEKDPAAIRERQRMRIGGGTTAWQAANESIRRETEGFHTEVADKIKLLNELQYGNSSVIIIYAHFDGTRLYLPGAAGGTISVDEIAKIDRTRDPAVRDRVIILAACSTAAPTESGSLASILLEKGIARTVLATDHPYDARNIPELMKRLGSGARLREAGGELHQYVELDRRRWAPDQFTGL